MGGVAELKGETEKSTVTAEDFSDGEGIQREGQWGSRGLKPQ